MKVATTPELMMRSGLRAMMTMVLLVLVYTKYILHRGNGTY
jgi:hypothetical protein